MRESACFVEKVKPVLRFEVRVQQLCVVCPARTTESGGDPQMAKQWLTQLRCLIRLCVYVSVLSERVGHGRVTAH